MWSFFQSLISYQWLIGLELQLQAAQVSCHLDPPLWLWNIDPACWLWIKDPGLRNQVHEETSLHLLLGAQDQWLGGVKQDQLPCGSAGSSSGNCQEIKICMVWACHTPQQLFQNHSSGYLGRWATPWSAEEMLDGQHQRVDIPAHARTAHREGLLQKRQEEDLCWIICHAPPPRTPSPLPLDDPMGQGTKLLNWILVTWSVKEQMIANNKGVYASLCASVTTSVSFTQLNNHSVSLMSSRFAAVQSFHFKIWWEWAS